MTYEEVLIYFGGTGYKIAKRLNISMAAPCHWKKNGYIPIRSQMKIEKYTHGLLKADLKHCGMQCNANNQ